MESKTRSVLCTKFLEALREDKLPWHCCWNTTQPINLKSGNAYRGTNNLLLTFTASMNGYTDPRWLTVMQAKEHGWRVRQGEHATPVEFWSYYDKQQQRTLTVEEVSYIKRKAPERIEDLRFLARIYAVFNGEQIDGIGEWQGGSTPLYPCEGLVVSREHFLSNLKVGFSEQGSQSFYQPSTDTIVMPPIAQFHSAYEYACTLLHVASHATGHSSRLHRHLDSLYDVQSYAREELRAEIASAFAAQALGLPMREEELGTQITQHKAYIQSWIQLLKNSPNELFAAIKDGDKIADYLLQKGQALSLADAYPQERQEAQSQQDWTEEAWELD